MPPARRIRAHPRDSVARRQPFWCSLLALGLAFGAGCFPTARLVARLAAPAARRELAGRNPGASSVNRIMGKRAAAVVLAVDVLKGYLPVTIGRAAGLDEATVEGVALMPMAGHIAVVKGRGGAALGGGVAAIDPLAFALLCPIWVSATIKRDNARGALIACLFYPVLRALLGRSRTSVGVSFLAPACLMYGRLRGPGWGVAQVSPRLLWHRLWYDAELQDGTVTTPSAAASDLLGAVLVD